MTGPPPIPSPRTAQAKTIVVTGASSGFGALTVRALARAATRSTPIRDPGGRNAAAVTALDELSNKEDLALRAVEMDLSTQSSVNAAIERITDEQSHLDVVVHNAGHMVHAARVVVVGNSAGAWGVLVLATDPPKGVVGVINVGGGRRGSLTVTVKDNDLVEAAATLGQNNRLPQLWLYSANDKLFSLALGHAMYDAFAKRSRFKVEFSDLPPFASSGHRLLYDGSPTLWEQPVERFLQSLAAK